MTNLFGDFQDREATSMNTATWTVVLLISGLVDARIGIWALKRAEFIGGLFSLEFAKFAILGSLVFAISIVLYLASLVGAPARPGFIFIWPISVVLFTAILLYRQGDVDLSAWQWITGTGLALASLAFWSWIGEGA
jgi:hypothetical protein